MVIAGKLPVYYLCLDLMAQQQKRVRLALSELEGLLALPPLEVECPIVPLPVSAEEPIQNALDGNDLGSVLESAAHTLGKELGTIETKDPTSRRTPGLLVCCTVGHSLAKLCVKTNPNFVWGAATQPVAIVYELSNKYIIWHELLHTLGAEDCYDKNDPASNPGPTCECPNCIMQYAPTHNNVTQWPFLCEANVRKIRKLFAQVKTE